MGQIFDVFFSGEKVSAEEQVCDREGVSGRCGKTVTNSVKLD